MSHWRARAGLAALAACLVLTAAPARAELAEREIASFLVQCIGSNAAGRPEFPTAERPGCPGGRLQDASRPLPWRKHDWAEVGPSGPPPFGFQISDSVLEPGFRFPVVVQTFDYGDGERRFGRFDAGGDGGDLVAVVGGAAYGVFTEDPSSGRQWFVGEGCHEGADPDGRLKSWLFFRGDVTTAEWRDGIARLNIARTPAECPRRFGSAYTRYRRAAISVPFRFVAANRPGEAARRQIDTIVSEHYGRDTIAASDHLERFFFGRGLGKYRWERWEDLSRTILRDARERADAFARSGRCMKLPYSEPPGANWVMIDCRTWTTLVRQETPYSLRDFGWPGAVLDALR